MTLSNRVVSNSKTIHQGVNSLLSCARPHLPVSHLLIRSAWQARERPAAKAAAPFSRTGWLAEPGFSLSNREATLQHRTLKQMLLGDPNDL